MKSIQFRALHEQRRDFEETAFSKESLLVSDIIKSATNTSYPRPSLKASLREGCNSGEESKRAECNYN